MGDRLKMFLEFAVRHLLVSLTGRCPQSADSTSALGASSDSEVHLPSIFSTVWRGKVNPENTGLFRVQRGFDYLLAGARLPFCVAAAAVRANRFCGAVP